MKPDAPPIQIPGRGQSATVHMDKVPWGFDTTVRVRGPAYRDDTAEIGTAALMMAFITLCQYLEHLEIDLDGLFRDRGDFYSEEHGEQPRNGPETPEDAL